MTVWALYALVLKKEGCRPKAYLGTSTHTFLGLPSRWKDYDDQVILPRYVKEALDEGYTITHKGLICWCPIPPPSTRFSVRALFLILETVFSIVFWAMFSKTNDYRMPRMCPWPIDKLEYDDCCSHAAIGEGLRLGGAQGLFPDQIEAYDALKKKRRQEASNKRTRAIYYAFKRRDFDAWQARQR